MADNNDALFREVDEELRREQMEKLWRKYGSYVLTGAALIVLFVGGKQLWDSRERAKAEAAGTQYSEAVALIADGKSEEAEKALSALAASGPSGYATLAELNLAGTYVKAGKTAEALAAYEKLSKSAATPLISSFAALQAAALKLGDADFTEMQNRLNELTQDTNPWHVAARELLGRAALKAGKLAEAKAALTPILGDRSATREQIGRVNTLLSTITAAEVASTPVAPVPATPADGASAQPAASSGEPAK